MKYTFAQGGSLRSVLFSLFFFVLCAAGNAQNEGWRPVNPGDNLVGTWEGAKILVIPKNEEAFIPNSSLKVLFKLTCVRGEGGDDMTVLIDMDFDQLLKDWLAMPEVKESGFTKDQLWDLMVSQLQSVLPDVSFHDYALAYEISTTAGSFSLEDDSLEINRRLNKLKVIFPEPVSLGLGDEGFQEIVLDKKR
ncbi:MAG: hypothetical protein LBO65_05030 [Spirochaetaceae bacterium]|nr:hypothetical protein [Spirochaetaceae bacterium]